MTVYSFVMFKKIYIKFYLYPSIIVYYSWVCTIRVANRTNFSLDNPFDSHELVSKFVASKYLYDG